jgi:hypothetical protein
MHRSSSKKQVKVNTKGSGKQFGVQLFINKDKYTFSIIKSLNDISRVKTKGYLYSKGIIIFKSSGNCKTRDFLEIGKYILLMVYLCHRETEETSAFPLETPNIFKFI